MKKKTWLTLLPVAVLGLYSLVSIQGFLLRVPKPFTLVIAAIPLLFILLWLFSQSLRDPEAVLSFRTGASLLVLDNLAVQLTGGLNSPLFLSYPLLILFFSLRAGIPANLLILGWILLMEIGAGLWKGCFQLIQLYSVFGLCLFSLFCSKLFGQQRRLKAGLKSEIAEVERMQSALTPSDIDRESILDTLTGERIGGDERAVAALDESLGSLIDLISREFEAHTAALFLLNRREGRLRLHSFKTESDRVRENARVAVGAGVVGWVAKEKKELFAQEFTNPHESLGYYEKEEFISSVASLPILLGSELEGVLTIDSREERAYTMEDREKLKGFARQIAILIDYSRRAELMKAEAVRFSAFQELAKSFSQEIEIGKVLDLIRGACQKIFPFDQLVIALKEDGLFTIERSWGLGKSLKDGLSFDPRNSLVGFIGENRVGMRKGELRRRKVKTPVFFAGERLPRGVDSFLGAPILVKEEVVMGVMVLLSARKEAYAEQDSQLLTFLASLSSNAIEKAKLYESTKNLAIRDGLTGLFNHRHFQEHLATEVEDRDRPLSLLLLDIDKFKRLNDRYGHPTGDEVLKRLARLFEESKRKEDIVARYGGEEFAVILPGAEPEEGLRLGEGIRESVEKAYFHIDRETLRITISVGVATYPSQARNKGELIGLADKALYKAKQEGRNRVVHLGLESDLL